MSFPLSRPQGYSSAFPEMESIDPPLYIYRPLDPSEPLNIRLLNLEPGESSETVKISIIEGTLREPLDFEALSYVWGGEEKPNTVVVEGRRLPVTANLYRALLGLRNAKSPRILWVDAICIDQSNIPERNRQVGIMRSIYNNAKQVVIWLGEEEETDELALRMMEKFEEEKSKSHQNSKELKSFQELFYPLPPDTAPEWPALAKFLQRSWFERVWTLQEIYVSKYPLVIFGPRVVSWDAISNIIMYIKNNNLRRSRAQSVGNPGLILYDFLLKTMPYRITDPRDRVFAVLGIVELNHYRHPDVHQEDISPYSSIKIDYSLTCKEVYESVARFMLLEAKELSYLPLLLISSAEVITYPEFPVQRVGNKQGAALADLTSDNFRTQYEHRLEVLQECETIIRGGEVGNQLLDDYWRFLVCDMTFDHKQAPQDFAEAYEMFRYAHEHHSVYFDGGDTNVYEKVSNIFGNALYQRYTLVFDQWSHGRVPCRTSTGFVGWVPRGTEAGDWITVLQGASVPFVLRAIPGRARLEWNLIGESYIHSVMRLGEVMNEADFATLEWKLVNMV
ncbi:hypothetical protein OIDMADRAFT_146401 [Oidiodendron maius Zn]|uniref:Heterokaryon incompatibility domain-containing protein n=1 Tax=Oidiodendron maius (strain Zn) TaxID=913774 RepID=A0A0C3H9B9_OIDMZ|nr:hypothetical protein OIDMADRAFT_146401 [Oidiodendron maius Zn]